jgi:hypothetical protein
MKQRAFRAPSVESKNAAPVAILTVKKSKPNLAENINGCGRRDFVNGKALPYRSIWCANPQLPI